MKPINRPVLHTAAGLILFSATAFTSQAGWNQYVAQQFPGAVSFDPKNIPSGAPLILKDGSTTVIRSTSAPVLRFPHGIYVVANSRLVIEEVPQGLEILTPFIIVENGGELLAGQSDPTNRYTTPLTFTLTGIRNENSTDQGIDDPQLYSLYDLSNGQYVLSGRKPGEPDPLERESSLFGNKLIGAGPGGRIDLIGAKGTSLAWTRLAQTIDVDQGINTNRVVIDGNRVGEWLPGDRIAVSTSDFEPDHTEEALIQSASLIQEGSTIRTVLTLHQIRHGVTGALTGGTNVWSDGPGTSFQWSHQGQVESAVGADIRASVALLTRNITVRSYRAPDSPRDALDTKAIPVVDTLGSEYTPTNGVPIPAGVTFSQQEYYPGKFGDPLSRTSNRRDIYGGHTLFRSGSTVRLMGVEFSMLGQPGNFGRIGRYPVHYHLAREATNSFVTACSITDSFNRWITVHGTFRLGVTNNVGYRSFGHGFYIEDGVEQQNVFDGNCGILARPAVPKEYDYRTDPNWVNYPASTPAGSPTRVPQPFWNPHDVYPLSFLDRENPSVFWVSNKQNYFRNNVAAGAAMAGRGFWLTGLDADTRKGPAWFMLKSSPALIQKYPYTSGLRAPMLEFYGNTAQSCWNGIGTAYDGNGVFAYPVTGGVASNWDTAPRFAYDADRAADVSYIVQNANPKVLTSPGLPPTDTNPSAIDMMARTTSFRNRQYGAWLRPYWWWVSNSQFVDNIFGATLVSGGNEEASPSGFWGLVNNSDFVGFSDNLYRNQSRARVQAYGAQPNLTDRNPSAVHTPNGNEQYGYPEVSDGASRNVYAGGTYGLTSIERRGYQFYDGPGPVLDGVSFHGFYPTVDASFPANSLIPAPNYLWTPREWATNWFAAFGNPTNRFDRNKAFLNAAIGWFGPGNQWKYSALTWTTNLIFDPSSVIVRHLVHDTYTFAGELGDGDRQTFIRDADGSLQGYLGAGSVNSWPAHRGIDWVHECRSAFSCLASPYHYGNTDIIVSGGNSPLLFGKVASDFAVPESSNVADDLRYFIKGFATGPVQIYGTLNAAGARYTLQWRQSASRGSDGRNIPLPPPPGFAIRFTTLEDTPGRNTMSYAVCFPTNIQPGDLQLTTTLVHVHQGYDNVAPALFSEAWSKVTGATATPLPLSAAATNTVTLASGTATAWWDAQKSQLILTVTNTQPRSRKAFPLGLCAPGSNQGTFAGRDAVAQWSAMVPLMEESQPTDRYAREPLSIETVFETVAKSLNDSPEDGGIIIGVRYTPPASPVMPDATVITPARLDDVFYDSATAALNLNDITVPEYECRLAASEGGSFAQFQMAYFRSALDAQPTSDPDQDGLTNLEEYWSGSNPLAVQGARHPVVPEIRTYDGTRFLTLRYRRPAGVQDLDFAVLSSEDLVEWTEDFAAHEREVTNNGDGSETVLVRTSRNVDAIPTRFIQLRVNLR